MSKSRARSIKTSQINMREINIDVTGTDPDPITPLGFDRFGIKSITKGATGQYTILFNEAFARAPMAWVQTTTAGTVGGPADVGADYVVVYTFLTTDGTTAADADFFLKVTGSEFTYDV